MSATEKVMHGAKLSDRWMANTKNYVSENAGSNLATTKLGNNLSIFTNLINWIKYNAL